GYEMAMGVMLGMLAGLLGSARLRPTMSPFQLAIGMRRAAGAGGQTHANAPAEPPLMRSHAWAGRCTIPAVDFSANRLKWPRVPLRFPKESAQGESRSPPRIRIALTRAGGVPTTLSSG